MCCPARSMNIPVMLYDGINTISTVVEQIGWRSGSECGLRMSHPSIYTCISVEIVRCLKRCGLLLTLGGWRVRKLVRGDEWPHCQWAPTNCLTPHWSGSGFGRGERHISGRTYFRHICSLGINFAQLWFCVWNQFLIWTLDPYSDCMWNSCMDNLKSWSHKLVLACV